jgi:hypothetical protein
LLSSVPGHAWNPTVQVTMDMGMNRLASKVLVDVGMALTMGASL